jgi:hypothetical protein
MTRTKKLLDETGDEYIPKLHYTVHSAILFGEPPNIANWLQEQIIACSGSGNMEHLNATLKYKRKFRLRMNWSNSAGETAAIRAWKCGRSEIVKVNARLIRILMK